MTSNFRSELTPVRQSRVASREERPHGPKSRRSPAWPFALPAFVAIAVTLLYPLAYGVWISLHVERLSVNDGQFAGLSNYWDILTKGQLAGTVGRTLVFTLGSLAAGLILGLATALALEAFPRASRYIRPILLTPWVIPGVAVAAVWLAILNPISGLANRIIELFGGEPVSWLASPSLAMVSLIVVNTWKGTPFIMLMLSAGLKGIPKDIIEAARVDGASYPRVVWHIILPGLRPVLSVTAVLAFIWTFNYFDLAYLLTDGGPEGATTTLPFAIWESSIRFNRFDQGAAYSVLSIALTSIAIIFYLRALRKQRQS